jgi:hypothetical protein
MAEENLEDEEGEVDFSISEFINRDSITSASRMDSEI